MYPQQTPQMNYGNYYQQQAVRPTPVIPQGLKGRPVSSLDEVRATAVDFDGSIFYFPNLANDTIYTKQINLDGTSSIRVYELVEMPTTTAASAPNPVVDNLVTKDEFTRTVQSLSEEISALKGQMIQPVNQQQQAKPQEFNF